MTARHPRKFRPTLTALGDRIVPAVNVAFANGVLAVTGDAANDTIVVRSVAATGAIQVNAVNTGHTLSDTFGLVVDGNGGADRIDAALLNTTFFSQPANLDGGDGNDTIVGTNGKDILTGGLGTDSLNGLGADDLLDGGDDDDTLIGGLGNDLFIGGNGTDRVQETANVNVTVNAATMIGVGTDQIGGMEEVQLVGGTLNNKFDATAATADLFFDGGAGNDTLLGGTGDDTLIGGTGNDSLHGGAFGLEHLTGGLGNDTLNGGGGINDRVIEVATGTAVAFAINQTTLTGVGTDTLVDVEDIFLTGTAGADTFAAGSTEASVKFTGLAGLDTVVATVGGNATLSNTGLFLSGNGTVGSFQFDSIDRAQLAGTDAANDIDASGFGGPVTLIGGKGNDDLAGGSNNDRLDGGEGDDELSGNAGADTLIGGGGNDTLDGGLGTDSIDGGTLGSDLFRATVALNGTLTNTAFVGAGTDALTGIDRALLIGSAADNVISASAFTSPVTIEGRAGNDVLAGGSKADVLKGEGGDDRIDGNDGNDTIDGGSGGTDTVDEERSANFVLTDTSLKIGLLETDTLIDVERADLLGGAGNDDISAFGFTGPTTLDGGAGNDRLTGSNADDVLFGGPGIDTVFGRGGADVINGGTGNDEIDAGSGNDTITGSFGNDTIDGSTGIDTLNEGFSSTTNKTFSMSNTAAVFTDNGVNQGTDSISGLERADILMLAGNNDIFLGAFGGQATVMGGTGNDRIAGGRNLDELNGGGGFDRVRVITDNDVVLTNTTLLAESLDNLTGFEAAELEGSGTAAQTFDATAFTGRTTMHGGLGNDTLKGGSNTDVLFGDAGNDRLEGNAGADQLTGGPGADTLLGGAGNDSADSDFGDFIDLGADEDGFVVQGTAGNDTILIKREVDANGAVAVVVLNGQEIRFNYLQGETVTVFASGGNDRVEMDASAGDFWKALFFGEDGNDTLIGGAKNDFLNGGAGNDSVDGGAGDDTVVGWTGRDTLIGGAGADQILAKDGLVDLLSVDGLDVVERDSFDPRRS